MSTAKTIGRPHIYPLHNMKVGEYFTAKNVESVKRLVCYHHQSRTDGARFRTQKVSEGIKVKRVR